MFIFIIRFLVHLVYYVLDLLLGTIDDFCDFHTNIQNATWHYEYAKKLKHFQTSVFSNLNFQSNKYEFPNSFNSFLES